MATVAPLSLFQWDLRQENWSIPFCGPALRTVWYILRLRNCVKGGWWMCKSTADWYWTIYTEHWKTEEALRSSPPWYLKIEGCQVGASCTRRNWAMWGWTRENGCCLKGKMGPLPGRKGRWWIMDHLSLPAQGDFPFDRERSSKLPAGPLKKSQF